MHRQAVKDCYDRGMSPKAIQKHLGIGKSTVWRALDFYGLTLRHRRKRENQKVIDLYRAGLSGPQIVREHGIDKSRVWKAMVRHGLYPARRRAVLQKQKQLKLKIIALYRSGLNGLQITREYGIGRDYVWKTMVEHGLLAERIQRRKQKEKEKEEKTGAKKLAAERKERRRKEEEKRKLHEFIEAKNKTKSDNMEYFDWGNPKPKPIKYPKKKPEIPPMFYQG